MGRNFRDKKILCPFFKYQDNQAHRITCEGLGDAASISWNFDSRDERQRIRQLEIFCQDRYTYCEVWQMIQKSKYDD